MSALDVVVVGAGPNGLTAAVVLAQSGLGVRVIEARPTIGGGARTAELTLPGYMHDVCSAVHAVAALSPIFRSLRLDEHGVEWVHPTVALAHPLDDGRAAAVVRSIEGTAATLGADAAAYIERVRPGVRDADALFDQTLGPIARVPRHPWTLAWFGLSALRSASGYIEDYFREEPARALFAGCAAHAIEPLDGLGTAAFGLVSLLAAHAVGWPVARGGSQKIPDALASALSRAGGEIETGRLVRSMADLPEARAYVFDVAPKHLVDIAGDRIPRRFAERLLAFRQGPGVFKLDWALAGPIPWTAAACREAGTVHVGGTLEEIRYAESLPARGEHAERPFVLVAQQSVVDDTRAPARHHTGWAYCHVPNGSTRDMTDRIEAQIERFAPGFRDLILARKKTSCADLEAYNPNCVGGDITGGANDLGQVLARPVASVVPYATPDPSIYLCSSSTPPGGGVHGMSGYHAARVVLERVFQRDSPALHPPPLG